MKSKKIFYINVILVFVNVLLIVLLTLLSHTSSSSHAFQPIKSQARNNAFVGQLRLSKDITTDMLTIKAENTPIKLDFIEITESNSSDGEGYVAVKAKQTVKMDVEHYTNYWLLHFCEEDGFWYLIYFSNYFERTVSYPAASQDAVNFNVPADLLSDPGQYAIAIAGGKGYCLFEISQ